MHPKIFPLTSVIDATPVVVNPFRQAVDKHYLIYYAHFVQKMRDTGTLE